MADIAPSDALVDMLGSIDSHLAALAGRRDGVVKREAFDHGWTACEDFHGHAPERDWRGLALIVMVACLMVLFSRHAGRRANQPDTAGPVHPREESPDDL